MTAKHKSKDMEFCQSFDSSARKNIHRLYVVNRNFLGDSIDI